VGKENGTNGSEISYADAAFSQFDALDKRTSRGPITGSTRRGVRRRADHDDHVVFLHLEPVRCLTSVENAIAGETVLLLGNMVELVEHQSKREAARDLEVLIGVNVHFDSPALLENEIDVDGPRLDWNGLGVGRLDAARINGDKDISGLRIASNVGWIWIGVSALGSVRGGGSLWAHDASVLRVLGFIDGGISLVPRCGVLVVGCT
jgi:hypothetical protein